MGVASLLNGVALGVRNCAYGGRFAAGAGRVFGILRRDNRNTTCEKGNAGGITT